MTSVINSNPIAIRGARTHNLKNINVVIPRDKLVVITGLSGSGKSSLAFDTLYAEGQRRYVESLSAYARQFLSQMEKPDVDGIDGLSPAIAIEQKSTNHNPRSTVGTITEIYDYLRLLFARVGTPYCPQHEKPMIAQSLSDMLTTIFSYPQDTRLMMLAPVVRNRKGEHSVLLQGLSAQGFNKLRIDGQLVDLDASPKAFSALTKHKKHSIDVVIDRFRVRQNLTGRVTESLELALKLGGDLALLHNLDTQEEQLLSAKHACPVCDKSVGDLEPKLFSFNNPAGACPACDGLGRRQFFSADRLVAFPQKSLNQGAIHGWDQTHSYYFRLLSTVANHFAIDMDCPWQDLPLAQQRLILYGSGDEALSFNFTDERGKKTSQIQPFEGILPYLQRHYDHTQSSIVKEELAKYLSDTTCDVCHGSRLNAIARHVQIDGRTIAEITQMAVGSLKTYYQRLTLARNQGVIGAKIINEIYQRLDFLNQVGLDYLTLARSAETLSGGEAQRIRLASQVGSGLVGVLYVLDEPSIGLHQRDNERLIQTLEQLRNLGNTVVVVEHDEDAIRRADYVIDMGIGAGVHGGQVIACGHADDIAQNPESLTGQYLSGKKTIAIPKKRHTPTPLKAFDLQAGSGGAYLTLSGARGNNLQNLTLNLPIGVMTCITGVSGSGKSTLINRTLLPIAACALNHASAASPDPYDSITGLEFLDKMVAIDQSPIGRTPRSNPATYTGVFTLIRELFAQSTDARAKGYKAGRFSFNVKGGRCEVCQGDGLIKVEMHFLPDLYVTCDTCQGLRYNKETLDVHYKGKSISDVLAMTVEDAMEFFAAIPAIHRRLQSLSEVGLSYICLGQSATTLSGGEAQRVKLAKELAKRDTGKTLYILDEPTTGLHFADVANLLDILHTLRNKGNTIVVIEHNLDVIKTADWVIDLGPEGGEGGGKIIAYGTPEMVADNAASHTGRFLKPLLNKRTNPS